MNTALAAADIAQSGLSVSTDASLLSLFWQAHWVVKLVMLGLLGASIWCWAIIFDKTMLFARSRRAMDRFEQVFWSGQSLEELYRSLSSRTNHNMAALFVAAMREWKRSLESQGRSFMGLHARIEKVMDVTIQREVERLESKLLVLATVGSSGPFIGLFGTVVGIMMAFEGIAQAGSTNLGVVARPIADALVATACGLLAAIPAVFYYNLLTQRVKLFASEMDDFAMEFLNIAERNFT